MKETAQENKEGLKKLREKFADNLIGKLPKPSKKQTDDVKKDYRKGIRCLVCGGWHHKDVVHLDYVGHAAATDRMLDADPLWSWEPLAVDENSLPKFDKEGGLWIKLTICGVTRLGYGDSGGKKGGNAIKEAIGDAIRNAGMRFGIALDLWCKEDLHKSEGDRDGGDEKPKEKQQEEPQPVEKCCGDFIVEGDKCKDIGSFEKWVVSVTDSVKTELDKVGNDKFRAYVIKMRDLLTPKQTTIICPMIKKEAPLEDCTGSDCSKTCDVYQETKP